MAMCRSVSRALVSALAMTLIPFTICVEDWHFTGPNIALGETCGHWLYTFPGSQARTFQARNCSLALDRNKTSCASMEGHNDFECHWGVMFDELFIIKGIRIYPPSELAKRDKLKNFFIEGFNYAKNTRLYDDKSTVEPLYQQAIISIPLTDNDAYNKVYINVPRNGHPTDEKSIQTLCEVQIFAVLCDIGPGLTDSNLKFRFNEGTGSIVDHSPSHTYVTPGFELDFSCNSSDHKLTGSAKLTCQKNGTFDASIPKCVKSGCSQPPNITHGRYVSSKPYIVGEEVDWICEGNYRSTTTYRPLTCSDNGDWNKPYPVCSLITCSYPGDIIGGKHLFQNGSKYHSGNVDIGTTISVECDRNFIPSSSNLNITLLLTKDVNASTCGESGQWHGENMKCDRVNSGQTDPVVHNADAVKEASSEGDWVIFLAVGVGIAVFLLFGLLFVVLLVRKRQSTSGHYKKNTIDTAQNPNRENEQNRPHVIERGGNESSEAADLHVYEEIVEGVQPLHDADNSTGVQTKPSHGHERPDCAHTDSGDNVVNIQRQDEDYHYTYATSTDINGKEHIIGSTYVFEHNDLEMRPLQNANYNDDVLKGQKTENTQTGGQASGSRYTGSDHQSQKNEYYNTQMSNFLENKYEKTVGPRRSVEHAYSQLHQDKTDDYLTPVNCQKNEYEKIVGPRTSLEHAYSPLHQDGTNDYLTPVSCQKNECRGLSARLS